MISFRDKCDYCSFMNMNSFEKGIVRGVTTANPNSKLQNLHFRSQFPLSLNLFCVILSALSKHEAVSQHEVPRTRIYVEDLSIEPLHANLVLWSGATGNVPSSFRFSGRRKIVLHAEVKNGTDYSAGRGMNWEGTGNENKQETCSIHTILRAEKHFKELLLLPERFYQVIIINNYKKHKSHPSQIFHS